MGIEDRDWYREERRRQRQAVSQPVMLFQDEPTRVASKARKGPPGLLNAASIIAILFALVVALGLAIGFA